MMMGYNEMVWSIGKPFLLHHHLDNCLLLAEAMSVYYLINPCFPTAPEG